MMHGEILEHLDRLIAEADSEDRPALVVALAARLAQLGAGMAAPKAEAAQPGEEYERLDDWVTPAEAAAIAKVPVTRIYAWAQGQRWASHPSRRCLRIRGAVFRRWLAMKRLS
jgi:hypothetical protein